MKKLSIKRVLAFVVAMNLFLLSFALTAVADTTDLGLSSGVESISDSDAAPAARIVPIFLHPSFEKDLEVFVRQGIQSWSATESTLTASPAVRLPNSEDGFHEITASGWYTLYSRGSGFYQVHTYFHVSEEDVQDAKDVLLPIENNKRSQLITGHNAGRNSPVQRHIFETLNPNTILRNAALEARNLPTGSMSIAAVERDEAGNRLPGQTFALGSDVAPWTGPNYFKAPMFRDHVYDPRTNMLIGSVDETRPLHQWTTHEEMREFIHELDTGYLNSAFMHIYNAGFAPHSFPDFHFGNPEYFQNDFVVFTTTDLTNISDWAEAGALIQKNGKPTMWFSSNPHGAEVTGVESGLQILYDLIHTEWGTRVVQNMNVVIYPGVNATGRTQNQRRSMDVEESRTAPGRPAQFNTDPNRDFMVQNTQEIWQMTNVWHAFMPHITHDAHEIGNWNFNTTFNGTQHWTGVDSLGSGSNWTGGRAASDAEFQLQSSPEVDDRIVSVGMQMKAQVFNDSYESGIRPAHYPLLVENPSIGSYYFGMLGGFSFLPEIRGQGAGSEMRRVYGVYVQSRSLIEYVMKDPALIHDTVNEVREDIIAQGKVYDEKNRVILDTWHCSSGSQPQARDMRAPEARRWRINLDGRYEEIEPFRPSEWVVRRERVAPTGYLVPLEIDWATSPVGSRNHRNYEGAIEMLIRLLNNHNIEFFTIEPEKALPLQQYYVSSANASNVQTLNALDRLFRADLRPKAEVMFDVPVLFIPMDQVAGTLVSQIMEPDMSMAALSNWQTGSHAVSWAQALISTSSDANIANNTGSGANPLADHSRTLLHQPGTFNLPIFRLTEDNPRVFMGLIRDVIDITSLRINSLSIATVTRGGTYSFELLLNEGATGEDVVWTIANPSFGYVDHAGNVTIFDKTGNVRLTATDPASGISHSITLRIAL